MREYSFIIAAGGQGTRLGGRKQFMTLAGRELWRWSADNAAVTEGVREIILVIPQGETLTPEWPHDVPLRVVNGGSERALSVLNGLNAATCDYVMVHDAARPFATGELFRRLMDAVSEDAGVVPVLPVSDALKRIEGGTGKVSCVDRDGLYITQTPQVFPRMRLIEAVRDFPSAKDEAEAWCNSGHVLRHVDGERMNFKVTVGDDMTIARALAERRITRTGLGWDVHRLVPGRRLILGGVRIESPLGLLGHSDADVLTHALMDAVLGGAGLPDIGTLFPASDDRYHDADSLGLMREVMRLVNAEGWTVEFADAVITAQVPRLNKHREEIVQSLSQFFQVNLKFKSAEGLDDSGRGMCMTCRAVATLGRVIE
ncbi:MAG: 2-C-methyl-D-erythritol 2,4-cyclodiphosphate synthase [Synergistaceae bacterium]|nr:2-C-methyl-D-erythritol 2,4-cyclodiphosphate synthase [Synergistaceae bacterium]